MPSSEISVRISSPFLGCLTKTLFFLLSMVLISCPSAFSEPMVAQAIMMTNSQYGVSRRLGTVLFTQNDYDAPVRITGELTFEKLVEKIQVGMHVHAFGNLTQGCDSTGPHFNPEKKRHGSPSDAVRHAGDLGNIQIEKERCLIDITDNVIKLTGPDSILGRSLVIHMNADDLGKGETDESSSTGNVGRPRGCGIIGVASDFSLVPAKALNHQSASTSNKSPNSSPCHRNYFSLVALLATLLLARNLL